MSALAPLYKSPMLEVYAFHISPSKSFKIIWVKSDTSDFSISFERVNSAGFDRLGFSDFWELLSQIKTVLVLKALEVCREEKECRITMNIQGDSQKESIRRVQFYKRVVDRMMKKEIEKHKGKVIVSKTDVINSTIRIFIERAQECLSVSREVKN